jgi:hypothetical protein
MRQKPLLLILQLLLLMQPHLLPRLLRLMNHLLQ